MAGAGYKLFATGDVLTAAQVNTYLMEQTVMRFADSAARTTALSGVLAEGMVSYLQDTNTLEVYDGAAWVGATGDITGLTAGTGISISSATGPVPTVTNSMATEITAKGDLIVGTGSATFDNLAAGSNGETLVADSSTSTGLRYGANFAAGKNKIINGDFSINQRGFTSTTTTSVYIFDRYRTSASDGTSTFTAQTFTPGAAPVAGYESTNYLDIASTGQTLTTARTSVEQRIEDVRTLAGQTATISFWAKAASGTPSICPELAQIFGSGGSSSVTAIGATKIPITTSWVRYTVSGVSVPSISGKTIGTGSELRLTFWTSAGSAEATRSASLGIQTATISIWGVQVEAGSVATAFQTATGTIQGELSACQRYYYRATPSQNFSQIGRGIGYGTSGSNAQIIFSSPVTMRAKPTSIDFSTIALFDGVSTYAISAVTFAGYENPDSAALNCAATSINTYRPYSILSNNSTSGFLGISAEL
jgi:hypothetical protein